MDNNAKTTSVFKKPEFWTTVVTGVSGLLLAFGVITPAAAGGIAEYAPQLIGALMAIISGSKFANTQRDEKVEVFRAMCAMHMEQAARAEKDLSQADLAEKVGVSRQTISAIEKGDYNPTINLCIRICKVLERTLDELFWVE